MRHFKRISLLLAVLILIGLLTPLQVFAIERQVVRLGYYEQSGFLEGMGDDQRKSGYAYEYLQRISDYTGWKYEYVYADLMELYDMMGRGEVDIIAGISRNDTLPVQMKFASQSINHENCNIYKFQDDETIKPGYVASFIGKRIGVLKGSSDQVYLADFLAENVVSCEVVAYDNSQAMEAAMNSHEIDVFVAVDTYVSKLSGITACLTIGEDDLYVCVTPSKRTVLRELNEADAQLRNEDPHFLEQLYARYYQNDVASVIQTDREKAWLQVHSELRSGYLRDYLPFCGVDEKER